MERSWALRSRQLIPLVQQCLPDGAQEGKRPQPAFWRLLKKYHAIAWRSTRDLTDHDAASKPRYWVMRRSLARSLSSPDPRAVKYSSRRHVSGSGVSCARSPSESAFIDQPTAAAGRILARCWKISSNAHHRGRPDARSLPDSPSGRYADERG